MSKPTNLLYVMTDHQRADSIGMVQAGVEVTPRLNALAAQGANFERAYNACPLCVPARTALATGRYPTANGVTFNDWDGAAAGNFPTLHTLLFGEGYAVAHAGVHHIRVQPDLKHALPWAVWADAADYTAWAKLEGGIDPTAKELNAPFKTLCHDTKDGQPFEMKYSNAVVGRWPGKLSSFKDLYFTRLAENFLRAEAPGLKQPFALFVHLWSPHPPLLVPDEYARLFDPEKLELPKNVGAVSDGEPAAWRNSVPAQLAEGLSEADWRRAWAAHLGLVRLADDCLGRLLDALEASGRAAETAVVFLSDHGEHLGQHRMYQKMEMYEPAVRTPLVVRAPGVAPRTIATPVSHLDVLPTLLDLFNVDAPDGLDGVSLAPALRGQEKVAQRPIFSMYAGNYGATPHRRACIDGRWKYVCDPAARDEELYDLEADALEMRNLAADPAHAARKADLRAATRAWHQSHGDSVAWAEA